MGIISAASATSSLDTGGKTVTAVVTWSTDVPADSAVQYSTGGTAIGTFRDGTYATSHSAAISGLAPSTAYSALISGSDANGNPMDSDASNPVSFTTPAISSTPPAGGGGHGGHDDDDDDHDKDHGKDKDHDKGKDRGRGDHDRDGRGNR